MFALVIFITFSVYAEEPVVHEETMAVEETFDDIISNLYVSFHFSWAGNTVHYGDEITLVPELRGYEGLDYYLTWQHSIDNTNWVDWASDSYVITEGNVNWYWRLVVNVNIDDQER